MPLAFTRPGGRGMGGGGPRGVAPSRSTPFAARFGTRLAFSHLTARLRCDAQTEVV